MARSIHFSLLEWFHPINHDILIHFRFYRICITGEDVEDGIPYRKVNGRVMFVVVVVCYVFILLDRS